MGCASVRLADLLLQRRQEQRERLAEFAQMLGAGKLALRQEIPERLRQLCAGGEKRLAPGVLVVQRDAQQIDARAQTVTLEQRAAAGLVAQGRDCLLYTSDAADD